MKVLIALFVILAIANVAAAGTFALCPRTPIENDDTLPRWTLGGPRHARHPSSGLLMRLSILYFLVFNDLVAFRCFCMGYTATSIALTLFLRSSV